MWPQLTGALTLLVGLFGIDFGYYVHLGGGQWHLIWNQVPVSEVIADEEADPFVRERLRLAEQIKTYAIGSLGLEGSNNYTTYTDIGDGPVVWALAAAPKDRLEPHRWSYPVIGSAPYRGFFDRERAEAERDLFSGRGFDVYLRGVSAYSTLGWFRDPLLTSMLRYPAIDLADLVIHELMHATVWIEGDADFNESLATFVGRAGARQWAVEVFENGRDSLDALEARRSDQAQYRGLMRSLAAELDTLYTQEIPVDQTLARKAEAIDRLRSEAASLAWQTEGYSDSDRWTVNNATLALFRTYHRETDLFDRVLERTGGLLEAIKVFGECEGQSDPEAYLESWLERNPASQ